MVYATSLVIFCSNVSCAKAMRVLRTSTVVTRLTLGLGYNVDLSDVTILMVLPALPAGSLTKGIKP